MDSMRGMSGRAPVRAVVPGKQPQPKVCEQHYFSESLGLGSGSKYATDVEKRVRAIAGRIAPDLELKFTFKELDIIGVNVQTWIDAKGPADQVHQLWALLDGTASHREEPLFLERMADGAPVLQFGDRLLVERAKDGNWKLVAPKARKVLAENLQKNFGMWKDQRVTSGHLWWKKELRPLDGKVQPDEVITFAQQTKPLEAKGLVTSKTVLTLSPTEGWLSTDWKK